MKTIIIGGGIGGLTTAITLRQQGLDYQIFEAAPELQPVGAGIWMAPNALQVLARLGVADAVKKNGCILREARITDQRGRLLSAMDGSRTEVRYGQPLCAIHRGRLQQVLLNALDANHIQLGKRVQSITQNDRAVDVQFADGTTASGDVLIGADGIHSAVRQSLFGPAPLRYSGQTCWRGVAHMELPAELRACGHELWGVRAGLRFGFSHIHATEVYWYLSVAARPADPTLNNSKAQLKQLAGAFPEVVHAILDATDESGILRTDLFDLKPIASWTEGRVALLGDAAHAMTPNLGQGGSQAIEDAWVLAGALAGEADLPTAFQVYQAKRMPKARRIVRTSFRIGQLSNLGGPLTTALRNTLLRWTPRSVNERQMDSLYRLNY